MRPGGTPKSRSGEQRWVSAFTQTHPDGDGNASCGGPAPLRSSHLKSKHEAGQLSVVDSGDHGVIPKIIHLNGQLWRPISENPSDLQYKSVMIPSSRRTSISTTSKQSPDLKFWSRKSNQPSHARTATPLATRPIPISFNAPPGSVPKLKSPGSAPKLKSATGCPSRSQAGGHDSTLP
ncbi:hypothetical protein ACLOJK_029687 [Asimina triloba]